MIRVIDLETSGMTPQDIPVEIGWTDVSYQENGATWDIGPTSAVFIEPGVPIHPDASAAHHITRDILDREIERGFPPLPWPDTARDAVCAEGDITAFAAHKADFERQWITGEIAGGKPFICTYKCAMRAWPDSPTFSNQGLRYWRGYDRGENCRFRLRPDQAEPAHRAGPDSIVTAFILADLLTQHSVETLLQWSADYARRPRIWFGKWDGTRWEDIPIDYLDWMLTQKSMDPDALACARAELKRRADTMPF